MTASMAKSGEAGDSPAPKEAPLPAGHAAGHHYTGVDSKIQSGIHLEIPSGVYLQIQSDANAQIQSDANAQIQSDANAQIQSGFKAKIPLSKYAGVGPMIAAGLYLQPAPGSFASLDLMAVASRFSHPHPMDTFRPLVPRTVQLPVVVQAPHDRCTVALFRNYMKRSLVLQQESLNALLDKREDRTEKRKLEEDRLKFEEEKRRAYLSLEEERKKFEEYKKQFAPKVLIEEEKGTTQSKIVNKLEAAEKHVSLFEKVVGIPKKSVELVKNIKENKDIVKNFMDRAKLIAKYLAPGSVGFLIEQMKEMAGLGGSGDAGEGLNDAVVVSNGGVTPIEGNAGGNGAGNGPNSGGNGAGNGPNSGALKVVNGAGKAPNGGALKVASSNGALKVPAVSTDDVGTAVAGASTVSTCTGTVSTTEVASAGAGGATVATTGDAVTGGAAATVSESTRDVCAKVVPTIGAKAE